MEPSHHASPPAKASILGETFRYLASRPVDSAVIWLLLGALPSWLIVYLFRANIFHATIAGITLFVLLSWALVGFFPLFPIALVAQSSRNDQRPGLGGLFLTFFHYLGRYLLVMLRLFWRFLLIALAATLIVRVGIAMVGIFLHNASIEQSARHSAIATSAGVLISSYLVLRRRVWAYYLGVLLDLKSKAAVKASIEVARTYRRFTEVMVLVELVLPLLTTMSFAVERSAGTLYVLAQHVAFPLVQLIVGVAFSLHLLSHPKGAVDASGRSDDRPLPE